MWVCLLECVLSVAQSLAYGSRVTGEPVNCGVAGVAERRKHWVSAGDGEISSNIVGGKGVRRAGQVAIKAPGVGPDAELDSGIAGHGSQA